jgi:hypothetical protein
MWHRKQRALRADASRSTNDAALRRSYAAASPRQRMHDSVLVTGWCRKAYFVFNQYVVHDLALTEPILARLPAARGRPGHKLVKNQAVQLAAFRRHDGIRRERGAIARWLEMKDAPKWVRRNRAALLVIEQKAYNRHRFWENLTLARTRIELR